MSTTVGGNGTTFHGYFNMIHNTSNNDQCFLWQGQLCLSIHTSTHPHHQCLSIYTETGDFDLDTAIAFHFTGLPQNQANLILKE